MSRPLPYSTACHSASLLSHWPRNCSAGPRAGVPAELVRPEESADADAGKIIGAELFRLVARDRELGHDPEMELRAAARATARWRARGNDRLIITESEAGFGDLPESAVAGTTQEPVLAGRPSAPGRLPAGPHGQPTMRPGSMTDLWSGIHYPYVDVGADILTPRISTTGADLNARSVRAAFATVLLVG